MLCAALCEVIRATQILNSTDLCTVVLCNTVETAFVLNAVETC